MENQLDKYINELKGIDDRTVALVAKYPWFSVGRRSLAMANEEELPAYLKLVDSLRQNIYAERKEIERADFDTKSTDSIIEQFIVQGDYKIRPDESTPDLDIVAGDDNSGLIDGEIITEELGRIFLEQGLIDDAKAIYAKLSLLYPKKSVYFAEIIAKAETEQVK